MKSMIFAALMGAAITLAATVLAQPVKVPHASSCVDGDVYRIESQATTGELRDLRVQVLEQSRQIEKMATAMEGVQREMELANRMRAIGR